MALHAGAVLGLAIGLGNELASALQGMDRDHVLVLVLGTAPAALVGVLLERQIESALGRPPTIALGLLGGSLAMAFADRAPAERRAGQARPRDGLWLGLAQAGALIPGVSRNGATLAAARARRFCRPDAGRLSLELSWPVILGAALLKGWRLRRSPELRGSAPQLGVGALVSLLATLATHRILRDRGRPLLPYALYRIGLATVILLRLRREATAGR